MSQFPRRVRSRYTTFEKIEDQVKDPIYEPILRPRGLTIGATQELVMESLHTFNISPQEQTLT